MLVLFYVIFGYPVFLFLLLWLLRKVDDIPRWMVVGCFILAALPVWREIAVALLLLYVYNVDVDKIAIKKAKEKDE